MLILGNINKFERLKYTFVVGFLTAAKKISKIS